MVALEKKLTQADQGSDVNSISVGLTRKLGLVLRSLEEVGVKKGLSMSYTGFGSGCQLTEL